MRAFRFHDFGLEHLRLDEVETPALGPGKVLVDVKALSLNYRDYLVVTGQYNPKLKLPAVPISDGAGVVATVGEGVTRIKPGDRVVSHFVSGWIDGPFKQEYAGTTLGLPRAGLAAEKVILPAEAVVPLPENYDFAQAATLPIAALTAWSALVTVGNVQAGDTILTLGTGGVSIFAVQFGRALGAKVIVTSSSDEKLARAKQLGAACAINYKTTPKWEQTALECSDGLGVDVVVENGGPGTLDQSMKATRAGGKIALLGALTGLAGNVTTGLILMKRLQIHGILVDSRKAFEDMISFIEQHKIEPVIGQRFGFEQLPAAFKTMEAATHFGKLVIELE